MNKEILYQTDTEIAYHREIIGFRIIKEVDTNRACAFGPTNRCIYILQFQDAVGYHDLKIVDAANQQENIKDEMKRVSDAYISGDLSVLEKMKNEYDSAINNMRNSLQNIIEYIRI